MVALASPPRSSVGELLRSWRQRRRLSQLELSLDATVSSRHLSFIETGRARPSRDMVLHLAEQLEVPLRERNVLLLAAGYAPHYGERGLDADDMAPIRGTLDRFLAAHMPYPAVIVDRHWDLVAANPALEVLTEGVAPELLEPPANGLRAALHPQGMAPRIANLGEWSVHLMQRLRRRAVATGDPADLRLHDELSGYPGVQTGAHPVPEVEIVTPLRLSHPAGELSFLSTLSTFVTAADVTLSELELEAFYPADAHTARVLHARGGHCG